MKVLDLQCDQAHVFEGWFADEQAFLEQQSRGLIACPHCESPHVEKMLSAPRLNLGSGRARATLLDDVQGARAVELARQRAQVRALIANTENVGERFAAEARAMHEGERAPRPIRGVASAAQVQELVADGVDVLPVPPSLIEPLH